MRSVHAVVLGCLALASTSALADTIQAKYTGLALPGTQTVKIYGVFSGTVYAGALNHAMKDGVGAGAVLNASTTAKTIATFCTELTQYVTTSFKTFDIVSLESAPKPATGVDPAGMGMTKANAIRLLWAGVSDKFTNAATAAAFQIAIWEIVYDYDGTAGSFQPQNAVAGQGSVSFSNNATAIAAAQNMFTTHVLNAPQGSTGARNLKVISHLEAQDQIVVIPLPTGGLLATAGLIGLAAIRRRR